jgi:release factor glutamine methyltransferase
MMLAHLLGISRAGLLTRLYDAVPETVQTQFTGLVERRQALVPVAYLTKEREFYGLPLYVDERVLVPRPETELLVDLALKRARSHSRYPNLHIADIGTGSGAIALAVAANLPGVHITAVDLSPDALEVARINTERHRLTSQIRLLQGNGLAPVVEPIDLLLSNPPYTILAEVDENVRRHEPHLALDGGLEGLDMIRELIAQAPRHLRTGTMLVEIGAWQGTAVQALAEETFPGARVVVHQDLAGLDRVLEVTTE